MANICNSAIVVKDKSSFDKIVSYFNSNKFERLVEKNDLSTDITGAEYNMLEYVIRVESKWGPEDIVFEKVSKLVKEKVTVYSNTEGGEGFWTGITIFENGVLVEAKEIPVDIRERDFRKLIYYVFKDSSWFIDGEKGTLILRPRGNIFGFGDSWEVSVEYYDNWTEENPIVKKRDYGRCDFGRNNQGLEVIKEYYTANNL